MQRFDPDKGWSQVKTPVTSHLNQREECKHAETVLIAVGFAASPRSRARSAPKPAPCMAGKAPGMVGAAQTVKVTATITAIDKATRDVTLKGPQGNEITVTAGPEVKNFDSLKVGDQVDIQYFEALTLELKKGGGMVVARTEQKGAVGAKPGESSRPAPLAARSRSSPMSSPSIRRSSWSRSRGRSARSTCKIPDPAQFKRIAKGDQVEATYTQALALVGRAEEVATRGSAARRARARSS